LDWINVALDKDRGRTVVKAVLEIRVPFNAGNVGNVWSV
jgi:hypothetical protein